MATPRKNVLKNTTALPELEKAWARLRDIRKSTSDNTVERNRLTRDASLLAARALAADEATPERCVAGFHSVESDDAYTADQIAKTDGTYAKELSWFRAIQKAAKADLDNLLNAWPDGAVKNDDGTTGYKPTLNRQQFIDIAVRLNEPTNPKFAAFNGMTGKQIGEALRTEQKQKSASKRTLSKPQDASDADLLAALRTLCGAAISRDGFPGKAEIFSLMGVLETKKAA